MSHDNDRTGQTSYHTCSFNTAGQCSCGAKMVMPQPSTTAVDRETHFPDGWPRPIDTRLNLGSPIGPGFVVYERAPGEYGYDRKMALASVGPGWAPLINAFFDRQENDIRWNQGRFLGKSYLTQVKEKFGTLRMYHSTDALGDYSYTEAFISGLEAASAHICEDCGRPGTTGGKGWIRTLCEECRTKGDAAKAALLEQRPDA